MSTEEQVTARQLSARMRGSGGDWFSSGYADENKISKPIEDDKPSTPVIGKSVKTYNTEEAKEYARRNRGCLNDIMGMQEYEPAPRPQSAGGSRPTSARGRTEEAQHIVSKSYGDSMKLVFSHTAEPAAATSERAAAEEAPEPEVDSSPSAETASIVSESQAAEEAAPAAEESPKVEEVSSPPEQTPVKQRPQSSYEILGGSTGIQDVPVPRLKKEAFEYAARNRGTLTDTMAGRDVADGQASSPRSARGSKKQEDSITGLFHNYGNQDAQESPRARVRAEGASHYNRNRISNIF